MLTTRPALFLICAAIAVTAGCGGGGDQVDNGGAGGGTAAPANLTTVRMFVGGEKMRLLENPEVKAFLANEYQLEIDATKAGSVAMVREMDVSGQDALWPSNDIAVEFFRMRGGSPVKDAIIFNSPIVVYTGWPITNALVQAGIVQERNGSYFIVKFDELLDMISNRAKWEDIGMQLYGNMSIRSTDPTKSNSGNMFAGLIANLFNGGDVVTDDTVAGVLPRVESFFDGLGMMPHSSGDIFNTFIATGINNSMVVGYENQIVEFVIAHPQHREHITNSVAVLYPTPTVWSSHPVIALTDNGKRAIEALKDQRLQELAWRHHGFRSGLIGIIQDPSVLGVPHIPRSIDSVMPLPTAHAMDRIVTTLGN